MMQSAEIRQQFFDFFKSKEHTIVPSAPIVIKDDPTLLFTNAGMNQFKEFFLGDKSAPYSRVADTQKCLRVSGKHNDLEEVGVDTYHHTMFEMLGNWSFGNAVGDPAPYFKEEAIAWSWELLTKVYKIPEENLYVTVFEGDEKEGLPKDDEAISYWQKWVAEDRIIMGNKKDNFWEMGDTGPCGPCTEIHIDCRTDEEKKIIPGKDLVNNDDPQVIEIWNIVFIQHNRKKDGSLESLPAKHVDTGMGFERLVRVLQNKQSNYDTDIFTGTILEVEKLSGKKYTNSDSKQDVAFRVIADHIRAIAFPIADGQVPSNTGAGYVIRRILRRAVRYYFSYLDVKKPMLFKLIPLIAEQFKNVFPELEKQKDFIGKVVHEEEESFLKTLGSGIKMFNESITNKFNSFPDMREKLSQDLRGLYNDIKKIAQNFNDQNEIAALFNKINDGIVFNKLGVLNDFQKLLKDLRKVDGSLTFKLQDTYGFPFDLTKLMASDIGAEVDEEGFENEMLQQKNRSRAASVIDTEDWIILNENGSSKFVGYNTFEIESKVLKYRKTKSQGKESYQIVLDKTPFYAESGGQVGDTGVLIFDDEKIPVINAKKENDLIIHFTEKLPAIIDGKVIAKINVDKRKKTAVHHSATHLMHAALRKILGNHVSQKGSLVNDEYLRFDFSHFAKVTDEEIKKIESLVNEKIRENIPVVIKEMKKEEALATGAMALFGEKYGDPVRVVTIDAGYSIELCGGTHVGSTGELGFFKIAGETAVGAGLRRIEALSGKAAEDYIQNQFDLVHIIRETLKNPKDIHKSIDNLLIENAEIKKQLEKSEAKQLDVLAKDLLKQTESIGQINFIGKQVEVKNADKLKKLSFELMNNLKGSGIVLLTTIIDDKPFVALGIDEEFVNGKNLDASKIIKEHIAPLIKGGGGGQKTLATAGGQDTSKLGEVIETLKNVIQF
ncbi:MAG TPA: alanine--tRNA ligase [Chitinophagaceae bacterium]|nr:alanine--tRNA ligase [Chitinophagaceae bacterium]